MNARVLVPLAVGIVTMFLSQQAHGDRGRGGAFGGGGGGRGSISGARSGGAALGSRPSLGGNAALGNRPSLGGARPGGGGGNYSPGISRPNVSVPNLGASRPAASPGLNRPNLGGSSSLGGASRPQFDRPSGSLKPSIERPATRPGLGNIPSVADRPTTLPSRPNLSIPDLDGTRPGLGGRPNLSNRPSIERPELGTRPGAIDRPGVSTLPGLATRPGGVTPPGSGDRPGLGDRPGIATRPALPTLPGGATRPGIADRPVARPLPGDLGDFLGMDRPIRPDNTLPTIPDRPGLGNRPGTGDRPGISTLPGVVDRPGLGNRPGVVDRPGSGGRPSIGDLVNRPIEINNRPINNHPHINNRPSWVNINNVTINNFQNNWQTVITRPTQIGGGIHNWSVNHPQRIAYWNRWGNGIRVGWPAFHHNTWFRPNWWAAHPHAFCGWHYWHRFHVHGWRFWWSRPAWPAFSTWFVWRAPAAVWSQPIFYDYGQGGNVVFQDNRVFIDGQQVATADEFAQSAAALATVPPPASEEEAAQVDWMPLGTFAVSMDQKEIEPSLVIQLAVSKEGVISGTVYNTQTEQAQTVQGQVDRETQRVAFRIAASDSFVAETGLYNLTQDEAPLLVHYGGEKTETWLLIRLEQPQETNDQ